MSAAEVVDAAGRVCQCRRMLQDRYGFALSTSSAAARDAYVEAVDLSLSANHGTEEAFRRAIAADAGLAVAHAGLARTLQVAGRVPEAKAAAARARELAPGLPHREQSHAIALATVIDGGSVAGLAAVKQHLAQYPRDAMVLAPCTGVFGLIGFSGRPGREAELLALLEPLADAYGEDWWFLSALAFAQVEVGEIDRALATIERSLAIYARNAHGAHIRAHVYYEAGERPAGLAYIEEWWRDYPKASLLHCHISWHIALWRMELGRMQDAWEFYRAHLRPGASTGPPLNTLTDSASFLFRAEVAGGMRDPELWRELSLYATQCFPAPGIAFADVHGALAHAFAGNSEALARIMQQPKGPAADVVAPLARAFDAFAREDWDTASARLQDVMAQHERVGGSRAQRDLIEYALAVSLLRAGRIDEARRQLAARRARSGAGAWPIHGM
jgi:tetratricopeptide (TPR) repeat protein